MISRDFLLLCSDVYHRIPQYDVADKVIASTVQRIPQNHDIQHVLIKVVLVNWLYNTRIYDTFKIAKHIAEHIMDSKIHQGDIDVIDEIRHGHEIRTLKGNKERDLYVFASKYIHWHNPSRFPIFDNLVQDRLLKLNGEYMFYERFTQSNLHNYDCFAVTIQKLVKLERE